MRVLVRHPLPGNIRERQNYIARAVILSSDGIFESLPLEQFESSAAEEIANPTLEDKVRQEIIDACRRGNWKLGGARGAAARLGLKRTTLSHKMRRLGIERPPVEETAEPTLEDKVRQAILAACRRANWKLGGPRGAAARLGLKRSTLFYRMRTLGIRRPQFSSAGFTS